MGPNDDRRRRRGDRCFLFESLEYRQLLNNTQLSDGLNADLVEASEAEYASAEAGTNATAIATTTSVSFSPPSILEGQPVTLSARVRDAAGVAADGGYVAFVARGQRTDKRYSPDSRVLVQGVLPATPWQEPYYLLGTAPVAMDGTASLALPSIAPGKHAVFAVYVGQGMVVFPSSVDGVEVLVLSPGQERAVVSWTGKSYVLFAGNSAFSLHMGSVHVLDSVPADAISVQYRIGGTWLGQRDSDAWNQTDSPPQNFRPHPHGILINAQRSSSDYGYDGYGTTTTYDYRLNLIDRPPIVPHQQTAFANSASPEAELAVAARTSMDIRTWGSGTFTNPPGITVGFVSPTSTLPLSVGDPTPQWRGAIKSSEANLEVEVPVPPTTPGSSGGGGGTSSGSGVILWGGGGSGSGYVPPRPLTPTGTVSFFEGSTLVATTTVNMKGYAGLSLPERSLAVGTHTLRVVYSGDDYHQPSESELQVTITHTPTTTRVVPSKTILNPGDTFTLKGVVSTAVHDVVTPSGDVRFYIGKTLVATVPLGESHARTFQLPAGQHIVRAVYAGDADCLPSQTKTIVTVRGIATRVSVVRSSWDDDVIALNSRIKPIDGREAKAPFHPTGVVRFYLNGKKLGKTTSSGRVWIDGKLKSGKYELKAVYSGDAHTLSATALYKLVVKNGLARLVVKE